MRRTVERIAGKRLLWRPHSSAGFTLLELLITMGIIMILASIAVENYQAAAIRARVARVKGDFRTLATAIEAYTVDYNHVPRMRSFEFYGDPTMDLVDGQEMNDNVSTVLSTPVAYLSNANLFDPFMEAQKGAPMTERIYTYQDIKLHIERQPQSSFWPGALSYYGAWRLASSGPDRMFAHGFPNSGQLPYDPTNGVVSLGNIWYSPKYAFSGMPPIPQLLDPH